MAEFSEIDERKVSLITKFIKDRPWIERQGQVFKCWRLSNSTSYYTFLQDNKIKEWEFEKVYNKVVSVR